MTSQKLKRNINILYLFSFCWLAMVIIPVIVPFFQSKGLDIAEVFYLQAIFAASVVIFELPSGYVADLIGRKTALVLGSLFHGLGFTLLCFADGFVGLMAFEITVGLGMSLLSGADLSLLYDSQIALGMSPREKTRGLANMRFIKSSAEGLASLLGGLLILWSFDLMVIANAIIAWIPMGLCFFLIEAPYQRMASDSHLQNFWVILRHLFIQDRLLRLTTLALTLYGLSTFYVVWLIQPYWTSLGLPLSSFGILWGIQNFVVALAARYCLLLEERFGPITVLVLMGLLPAVGYFGMAFGGGLWGVLLAFSFYLSRGFHQVILTDAFNSRVPSEFRSTANSFTSFLFRLIFIVTGPVVGLLYEYAGMSLTLAVLGVVVLMLFVVLLIPLLMAVGGEYKSSTTAA